MYKKFWHKSLHSINFDNPVYSRKNNGSSTAASGAAAAAASEAVNLPDRSGLLLAAPPRVSIGISGSSNSFESMSSSGSGGYLSTGGGGSSSLAVPSSGVATRTFTSTTLVQDATEVRDNFTIPAIPAIYLNQTMMNLRTSHFALIEFVLLSC